MNKREECFKLFSEIMKNYTNYSKNNYLTNMIVSLISDNKSVETDIENNAEQSHSIFVTKENEKIEEHFERFISYVGKIHNHKYDLWIFKELAKHFSPSDNFIDSLNKTLHLYKRKKHLIKEELYKMDYYALEKRVKDFVLVDNLKNNKKEIAKNETEIIYSGPEGKCVIPLTHRSAQFWGLGTKWCTSAENKELYEKYTKSGPLIIFILNRKDSEGKQIKYQYHFSVNDTDISENLHDYQNKPFEFMPFYKKNKFEDYNKEMTLFRKGFREFHKKYGFLNTVTLQDMCAEYLYKFDKESKTHKSFVKEDWAMFLMRDLLFKGHDNWEFQKFFPEKSENEIFKELIDILSKTKEIYSVHEKEIVFKLMIDLGYYKEDLNYIINSIDFSVFTDEVFDKIDFDTYEKMFKSQDVIWRFPYYKLGEEINEKLIDLIEKKEYGQYVLRTEYIFFVVMNSELLFKKHCLKYFILNSSCNKACWKYIFETSSEHEDKIRQINKKHGDVLNCDIILQNLKKMKDLILQNNGVHSFGMGIVSEISKHCSLDEMQKILHPKDYEYKINQIIKNPSLNNFWIKKTESNGELK